MIDFELQLNQLFAQMDSERKRLRERLKQAGVADEIASFWNYNIGDALDEYKNLLKGLVKLFEPSAQKSMQQTLLDMSANIYGGLPHLYYHYRLLNASLTEPETPEIWSLEEDDEQNLQITAGSNLQDKLDELSNAFLEAPESQHVLQRLFTLPPSTWAQANTLMGDFEVFEKRIARINAEVQLTMNVTWVDYPQSLHGSGFCLIIFFVETLPWFKHQIFNRVEFLASVHKEP